MATKTAVKKKKRTLSPKQKAALAKGRAAMAAKRKKAAATARVPKKKATVPKKKGTTKRKVTVVKVKTENNKPTTKRKVVMAKKKSGKKVSYSRRASGFLKKAGAANAIKQSALAVAGGIAGGVLSNKVPIQDARIKAMLPIAAGLVLAGTVGQKNDLVAGLANGMMVIGTVSLFKKLAPNVPMLAGEDYYYLPAPDYYSGNYDLSGAYSLAGSGMGYVSPANI